MENNEIKLYVKFPVYYYLILVGIMVILPLYNIIFSDYGQKVKLISMIILIFGICVSLVLILINIFRKTGYIITKEGITQFSLINKKKFLWDEIVNYTVNGYEKRNDFYLRFYTESSLKNKGTLKPQYVINISTKLCKIDINELIKKINKIRNK